MENEEILNLKVLNNNGQKLTIDEIRELIKTGEKIDVEFKESKIALNKDVLIQFALLAIGMVAIYF